MLQYAVRLYDIGVGVKCLGTFAESGFSLQIALEVQVAQFDIDFYEIVELLLIAVVLAPQLLYFGCGHRSDGFPLCLQVAHLLQVAHDIGSLGVGKILHLRNDILLAQQVLLEFSVLLL